MSSPPKNNLEAVVLDMHFYQDDQVDFGLFSALMEFYEPHRRAIAQYIDQFNAELAEDQQSWRNAMQYMPGFTPHSSPPPKEWMNETGQPGSRRSGQMVEHSHAAFMHQQMQADHQKMHTEKAEKESWVQRVHHGTWREDAEDDPADVMLAAVALSMVDDIASNDGDLEDFCGGGGESGGGGSSDEW